MKRRLTHLFLLAVGIVLLAGSAVSLVPMLREHLAARALRSAYALERLDPVTAEDARARFTCEGRTIVLSDTLGADTDVSDTRTGDPGPGGRPDAASPDDSTAATPEGSERAGREHLEAPVTVLIDGVTSSTEAPVRVRPGEEGANRYWSSVAVFSLEQREGGETRCGVVHRLPFDTAAARRARAETSGSVLPFLLGSLRGEAPPYFHGYRFRALFAEGRDRIREERFDYRSWTEPAYRPLLGNLVAPTPMGVTSQILSYWPSLLFPVLYPLGTTGLGLLALFVGGVGWIRATRP